jgi:hypothetical protein
MDLTKNLIHAKILLHPDSLNTPNVYSKTQIFDYDSEFLDLSGVVIKNKVNNYFNFNGYLFLITLTLDIAECWII